MSNLKKQKDSNTVIPHTVIDFISHYKKKYPFDKDPQPMVIDKICGKLCDLRVLTLISRGKSDYMSSYLGKMADEWDKTPKQLKEYAVQRYECAVYVFSYIYDLYRSMIIPIIYYSKNGDVNIGTGFYWNGGIATAKHCLADSESIAIQNVPKELLNASKIYISDNPYMDVAFIDAKISITNSPVNFNEVVNPNDIRVKLMITNEGIPKVMDEVITMGYPKIPGFTHFQTVEKATISALPQKRFASTTGEVAAIADEIWMKENLFLITAKIKGGNSGGPVINKFGELVGMVSEIPFSEGDYDDLGYGTAIPIKFLKEISQTQRATLDKINFIDYKE